MSAPAPDDPSTVRFQIGREPRGRWTVTSRCSFGRPMVIRVAPALADGTPFPTTFWLTCPWLTAAVFDAESAGGCAAWTRRLAAEPLLAASVCLADGRYRAARAEAAGGHDPCGDVGMAGQADPLAVKCLHARVAAALGGIPDPVGAGVLAELATAGTGAECADDRCAAASEMGVGAAG